MALVKSELLIVLLVITLALFLSVSMPLLTYSVGLVLFGFMHVARELHYVDHRFGARLGAPLALCVGIILFLIMLTRFATVFSLASPLLMFNIELSLVFLLTLAPQFFINAPTLSSRIVAGAISLSLGLGFLASPSATIVILAVLHNVTPMGFMIEIVKPQDRHRIFTLSALCFLVVPLLIACGFFQPLVDIIGYREHLSIFPTGPLDKHLGVFLPAPLRAQPWAHLAFSAVVFAQCMHYLAVIYVMPIMQKRLTPHARGPLFMWPHSTLFWFAILSATALLVTLYTRDFFFARSLYGIVAALHAYVEIPILLWALAHARDTTRQALHV